MHAGTDASRALLDGRLLAKNTVWNFLGLAAPLLAGLFVIPALIHRLGTERFGMLTLIWAGIGYFSIFDMGIGRALTKLVSERVGLDDSTGTRQLVWSGLGALLALGVLAGASAVAAAPFLVEQILRLSPGLVSEGVVAFRILGLALPAVLLSVGLVGVLEAHQHFRSVAAVRVPLGVLGFVAPLLAVLYSPTLVAATVALLVVRLGAASAYARLVSRLLPNTTGRAVTSRHEVRALLGFGGWLTVTNVVGPIMVYVDRFIIGGVLAVTAVAHYATPFDVLARIEIIPTALMGVLFPAFSIAAVTDPARLAYLYGRAVPALLAVSAPLLTATFLFAHEALTMWIDSDFADAAAPVARWLSVALLVNLAARGALTVLQARGRPDLVAKTHLAELLPYLALLWVLTMNFGIIGTAAAWLVRVLADTLILNELARRHTAIATSSVVTSYAITLTAVAVMVTGALIEGLETRLGLLLLTSAGCAALGLRSIHRDLERLPHPNKLISNSDFE